MANEWYTPPRYIGAALDVMGEFDLDPASTQLANKTVGARNYYTKKDNGLVLPWYGKVWLNPPYGRDHNVSILRLFIERLVYFYEKGEVQEAIVLTTVDTDELWWRLLVPYLTCFADHKVYYHRPNEKPEKHMLGTALTYLGKNEQRFLDVFDEIGPVYGCVSRVKRYALRRELWRGYE